MLSKVLKQINIIALIVIVFSSCSDSIEKRNNSTNNLDGNVIFKKYCNDCHYPLKSDNPLKGVFNRMPNKKYFDAFITNQDSLIESNDPYTKALLLKWNSKYSHNFKLNKFEVNKIADYINRDIK